MLAVRPAVPVLVAGQAVLLVRLEAGELVGAEGHVGACGGAVVGLDHVARGLLSGLIERLVDQAVGVAVVLEEVGGQRVLQDDGQLVVAGLDKAHVLPGGRLQLLLVEGHVQVVARVLAPLPAVGQHVVDVGDDLVGDGHVILAAVLLIQILTGLVDVAGLAAGIVVRGGVAPEGAGGLGEADVQRRIAAVGELVGLDVRQQVHGGALTGLGVVLRVVDRQGGVVHGGLIVVHLGIQALLHGVDVAVSVDGRAVLPARLGVQRHAPGVALGGLGGDAPLGIAGVLRGHVLRLLGGHLAGPLVAVRGVVENQLPHVDLGVVGDELHDRGVMAVPCGGRICSVAVVGIRISLCLCNSRLKAAAKCQRQYERKKPFCFHGSSSFLS